MARLHVAAAVLTAVAALVVMTGCSATEAASDNGSNSTTPQAASTSAVEETPESTPTPTEDPVSWRDGCKVPAEGDIYATQKRVPTSFSELTTKAPSLEQYVVCTWNQSADTGELLATAAQLDLTQGWSVPLDALSSDGWEICAVQGKSWFMTLNGDLTEVLQVAYLPDLSAAEVQTFGPLNNCTAGD